MADEQQTTTRLEAKRKTAEQELADLHIQINAQDANLTTEQGSRDSLQAELAALQKELAGQKKIVSPQFWIRIVREVGKDRFSKGKSFR